MGIKIAQFCLHPDKTAYRLFIIERLGKSFLAEHFTIVYMRPLFWIGEEKVAMNLR